MKNEILLAFRSLLRHRLSFILAAVSMAIGLSSVVMISSVGKSGKDAILHYVKGIGMEGLMFTHTASFLDGDGFDQSMADEVETLSGGQITSMPFSLNYGEASLTGVRMPVVLWGVGLHPEAYISSRLLYGRMPDTEEIQSASRVVVISEEIAEKILGRRNAVGQTLKIGEEGREVSYRIIGVIESGTGSLDLLYSIPSFVYAPEPALSRFSAFPTGRMIAKSDTLSDRQVRDTVNKVIEKRRGSSFSYEVTDFDTGSTGAGKVADVLTSVLTLSSSIALAVAGIGIMSTLLGSVSARKKEIGILKALGATDLQVAFCFLTEALMIAAAGIASGLVLSFLLLFVLFHAMRLSFTLHVGALFVSILSALGIGLLFGILPAVRAAREDPIDALRAG